MFFKQFVRDDLGCASYLIGDTDAGECVVVDPQWDVSQYLQTADKEGMRVRYVVETHNHADHVSGHGKLAQRGAQIAIYKDAGVDYPHIPLKDGDTIEVGNVRLGVLHTPGHRPEHIALTVTDASRAEEPWLVLTGDALFVGDVGRPDLAVEPGEGASQLYTSLQSKLLNLSDGVELFPGHVAGSLCGKSMSPKASSTIGFERRYNHPLTLGSGPEFVREVTSELPPQPPRFGSIVAKNRGPLLAEDRPVRGLNADEVDAMRKEGAVVLDARTPAAFGASHIPGALNIDLDGGQFGTRAAWVIPPEANIVLVLERPEDLDRAVLALVSTGQDHVVGYLVGGMRAWDSSGRQLESVQQMAVSELHERLQAGDKALAVVDVREDSEWKEGHIPGAIHIRFHDLAAHLDELPSNRPIAAICGGGTRSSIAASILQAQGFEPINIKDGMDAWNAAGYERER
jgi:glyoxylase-like metal-dependent hydrolase (beta-lactamase superfamily II)/rhodanese-related sulfurtransferase